MEKVTIFSAGSFLSTPLSSIQKEKSSLIKRGVSSIGYKDVARVMFSRILKEYFKMYLMVLQQNKVCSGALLRSKAEQR